jgi:hypothetical protein
MHERLAHHGSRDKNCKVLRCLSFQHSSIPASQAHLFPNQSEVTVVKEPQASSKERHAGLQKVLVLLPQLQRAGVAAGKPRELESSPAAWHTKGTESATTPHLLPQWG